MATYNHEKFIGKAIESVVTQKTDFPFELVIGEDCSKDSTRAICERYAAKHPEIVRLLPSDQNWGMSKNGIRIMSHCRGKYIAILDGDDFWSDPYKLRDEVAFLEQHPEYGMVHTDVDAVSETGEMIESEEVNHRRENYEDGRAFFTLLGSYNFINSCTAMFRHDLLHMTDNSVEQYWFSYDLWYWLRISMRSKVHRLNKRTACYRMHQGGITNTAQFKKGQKRNYYVLFDVLKNFYDGPTIYEDLTAGEKRFLFQKLISLVYRRQGNLELKLQVLRMMPRYFPGLGGLADILLSKIGRALPKQAHSKPSHSS